MVHSRPIFVFGQPALAATAEDARVLFTFSNCRKMWPPIGMAASTAHSHARTQATPTLPGYDVYSTIGRGHFGDVRLVRPVLVPPGARTRPLLAAKFVRLTTTTSRAEVQLRRCRDEFELQRRARGPHVCEALETVVHDGHFALVQEYASGGDLRQLLDFHRSHGCLLPVHDDWLVHIACALAHCHAAGIVHGDVKPENIVVSQRGGAKLIDFGCADECTTRTGGCVRPKGTIPYMSPELWTSAEHGSAVDVWAFGVLLYRAWNGGLFPFPRLTFGAPNFLQQYERLPDFERNLPSPRHAALVRRMLSYDPAARPAAEDVLNELVGMGSPT